MKEIINPDDLPAGVLPGPHIVALVSCGSYSKPNLLPISYVGQLTTNLVYISVRPGRYSNDLIRKNKTFAINYMDTKHMVETDYCGFGCGAVEDKFKTVGFTKEKGKLDQALVQESPLSIECEVKEIKNMGDHDIIIGRVISIVRRTQSSDWLLHDNFNYIGKEGIIGRLFNSGKSLKKK